MVQLEGPNLRNIGGPLDRHLIGKSNRLSNYVYLAGPKGVLLDG